MNQAEQQKQQAAFWRDYSQRLSTAIRYHEALNAAERAVSLESANAEGWYIRGTCFAMLARNDEALQDFEHALSLDAQYAPAWDGKAWVLGIMGRKDEALAAIHTALALDPTYLEAQRRKQRLELL